MFRILILLAMVGGEVSVLANAIGQRQLTQAISAKQTERIRQLINRHQQLVDYRDQDGVPLLLIVAENGMMEVVEDLLLPANGSDPNAVDQRGENAIHRVITANLSITQKLELLETLSSAGTNLNLANYAGDTPMHIAALSADLSSIEFLHNKKVEITTKNRDGLTPLELAQQYHTAEALEPLQELLTIEQAAEAAEEQATGATEEQATDFSQYLGLSTGIEESVPTIELTAEAQTHWWLDVGRYLAQWQHEPANTYQEGLLLATTVMNLDFRFNDALSYPDVVTGVQSGLDVNATDENGRGPLFWSLAIRRELGLRTEVDSGIMNFFIDNGAELDALDIIGKSLAHVAAYSGDYYALKELTDRGADLQLASDDGLTPIDEMRYPLQSAVILDDAELLTKYLNDGHDINYPDADGNRAVHFASQLGNLPLLKILQEHDADLESAGAKGYRPIHFSAEAGHLEITQFLVEQGVDVNARSQFFLLPTQLAKGKGSENTAVTELLQANGGMLAINKEQSQQRLNEDLKQALQTGDLTRVKESVALGAEINVDLVGGTALHYAAISGRQDIFAYLVDLGANINTRVHYVPPNNNVIYLHHLDRFVGGAGSEKLQSALTSRFSEKPYKRSIASEHFVSETPIFAIIRNGDEQFLSYAISRGADVNVSDAVSTHRGGIGHPFGTIFPLTLALLKQSPSMIDQLLKAGASPYALLTFDDQAVRRLFGEEDFINRRYTPRSKAHSKQFDFEPKAAYTEVRLSAGKLLTMMEDGYWRSLAGSQDDLWNLLNTYGIEKEENHD